MKITITREEAIALINNGPDCYSGRQDGWTETVSREEAIQQFSSSDAVRFFKEESTVGYAWPTMVATFNLQSETAVFIDSPEQSFKATRPEKPDYLSPEDLLKMFEQGYRAVQEGPQIVVISPRGSAYRVDILRQTCTCKGFVHHGRCKHPAFANTCARQDLLGREAA